MLGGKETTPTSIDDHKLHIDEHIAFMLGEDFRQAVGKNPDLFKKFEHHVNIHKQILAKENTIKDEENKGE